MSIKKGKTASIPLMNANLSLDLCVEMLDIARRRSSDKDFFNKVEDFVADNLSLLIESGDYLKLSFDSLKGLLCREELMFGPEEELFYAVMSWLDDDHESRMQFHMSLMELIRFPLMTATQIDTVIEAFPELMPNPPLNKILKEAQEYRSKPVHQRVLCQNSHTRLRMKPSMFIITKDRDGWFALTKENDCKWYNNCDIVHKVDFADAHRPGYIAVNDFLVTCGGVLNYTSMQYDTEVTGKCYIFDPREYKWTELASMCMPRQDVELVQHKELLYALGGSNGLSVPKEIERYSFETNQWEVFTIMYSEWKPSFGMTAACVVNDRIYTCDGWQSGIKDQNKMAFLDIPTKTWQMAPMKKKQIYGHPMWFQGDLLYAVQNNPEVRVVEISWYDPKTGEAGLVSCQEILDPYIKNVFVGKERVYFLHDHLGLPNGLWDTTELVIQGKSVINTERSTRMDAVNQHTKYFVQLRLPWDATTMGR